MPEEQPISEAFGNFVAAATWDDLDDPIRHEAKRSILNYFATAIGSANDAAVDAGVRTVQPLAGPNHASIIGRPERVDMLSAAFVNAISANLLDYDDTHLNTIIHPTAPVAAPALSLAEARGLCGREVLLAFVLGVEVECRLGNAVSPGHYARGWHITSTCGVFGGAAACAKLLGLTSAQTAHAIGIAASESAGLVENLPSAAKNVSVGNAARNGIFAALIAQQGYNAAPRAIEGPLGWARAMGDELNLIEFTAGLGKRWEIAKNTYKPYPAGIVFHSVIDACFQLRERHGLTADQIASVVVRGHQLLLDRGDRKVANERDARVSIHHSVAIVFLFGAAGLREFSETVAMDPQVATLRAKVSAELHPALPIGAAIVTVKTTKGETLSAEVIHARGSLKFPLSDADIEAKLRDSALQAASKCDVNRIIEKVWNLDRETGVKDLMRFEAMRK
jgi:2-methylcitrate dehydratase PrpD